jgi:hypothetical protein
LWSSENRGVAANLGACKGFGYRVILLPGDESKKGQRSI